VEPPDPLVERALLVQGILTSTDLPAGEKMLLIALLHELSFTEWREITARDLHERYDLSDGAVKDKLQRLTKRGLVELKWEPYFVFDERWGKPRPRRRYLRRLCRARIIEYAGNHCPVRDASAGDQAQDKQDKWFFSAFRAHVSCRALVEVDPRTRKFRATWRGEEHPSCHLYGPDEDCAQQHWWDFGDPFPAWRDSFDLYCLISGHYSYQDGVLRLHKKAAYPGARALLERALAAGTTAGPEGAEIAPVFNDPGGLLGTPTRDKGTRQRRKRTPKPTDRPTTRVICAHSERTAILPRLGRPLGSWSCPAPRSPC
jgi:hypothetical protein